MNIKDNTLICLVDAHHGRLIRFESSDNGECVPVELGRYRREETDVADKHATINRRLTTRDHFDSVRRERDRRYAKGLMTWVADLVTGRSPRRLVLMATPKLLSTLWKCCPARLREHITKVRCDLAQVELVSLAKPPAVLEAVRIRT